MHMSGDMYNGEFACNDMEGCGVYRTSDGAEISGESARNTAECSCGLCRNVDWLQVFSKAVSLCSLRSIQLQTLQRT
jgi:hypothetical protein